MHSALVKQHFFNPRNVGDIGDADGQGTAGSVSCGAVVRISLSIDDSQRITDARFKSAGCSYLVAALSFLTCSIKGKTSGKVAALAQSPSQWFMENVGEWPPEQSHCASLACEALVTAIQSYSDAVRSEWSGDEALICTCFGVSERTIEREIVAGGLRTIAEVTKASNAGAGCQSCYPLIEDILSQHAREDDLTF